MDLFGTMPDGRAVHSITLKNDTIECEIITYGGSLRRLVVPGRNGRRVDIALGFDSLEDYRAQKYFMGALVGRYANRIGGAAFDLNGVHYPLAANNGPHHLHGGPGGYWQQVWDVEAVSDTDLTLGLVSPDGEEGYPGTLTMHVRYALEGAALRIEYRAVSDKDTICNLTNHSYFNLSGHDSGDVEDQQLRFFAGRYTPTDAGLIPTGELASVADTPMDFRTLTEIGARIRAEFAPLKLGHGYDHNFVIDGTVGVLRPAAEAFSPRSGVFLALDTDQAGVQFYTGNGVGLFPAPPGKGGFHYGQRAGFCLETQCHPDTPHHPDWPGAILRAGEEYRHTAVFRFDVK